MNQVSAENIQKDGSVAAGWFPLVAVLVLAAVALTIAALPFILPPPTPRP